jgi:uncharacterized protein YndB with AHSA1/START domain
MSTNSRVIKTVPDHVWDVLADGWLYPLWVVGATRMRAVDASFPEVGSKLHHSAGVWPVVINDETEVLACDRGRSLRLRAAGWPMGEAEVVITLTASGAHTHVELREDAVSGPGAYLPAALRTPMIAWRNTETLRRLAFVAEGRSAH